MNASTRNRKRRRRAYLVAGDVVWWYGVDELDVVLGVRGGCFYSLTLFPDGTAKFENKLIYEDDKFDGDMNEIWVS